jgi:hypothetical protein
LKKHKITLKKKTFRSEKAKSEVVQEQRLGYWHKIGSVPAEDIVAVDETATWEGMERKVAWSLQGKKVYSYRQKNKGQKYTLIGAIAKHTKVGMIWVAGRSPTLVSQNLKATTLTYLAIAPRLLRRCAPVGRDGP